MALQSCTKLRNAAHDPAIVGEHSMTAASLAACLMMFHGQSQRLVLIRPRAVRNCCTPHRARCHTAVRPARLSQQCSHSHAQSRGLLPAHLGGWAQQAASHLAPPPVVCLTCG